ncbi:phosphoribosylanthranilate isomerase [Clostridium sp. MSJ-8]|uniref:phosphoribosylanthranilate isomerase n=1 Tax=Clostridium sp. MSJ-8 TaxID=2841510 RepID=UPI0020A207DE|nr:phosphoribosylanthranilate isomerase [Clostridium sp. MSJ-8]
MFIKICGITKLSEIDYLNELKPDYIGFVFAKSKRQISGREACILKEKLSKDIKTVGVFLNNTEEEILKVLDDVELDVIQLHGDEDNKFIDSLRKKIKCDIWKAVAILSEEDMKKALEYNVDTLVLDGSNPGSGVVFDWTALNKLDANKRIFLAGGINEENVLDGIKKVNPDGIDTSSGVEIVDELGRRKDKEKMRRLIRKVREN